MTDQPMTDLIVTTEGRAGRITMNRPKALNALSWEMSLALEAGLNAWKDDPAIDLVVIDACEGRAFGAGGDIRNMWEHGSKGDYAYSRGFWSDEYRMNALLRNYPKPVVSFVDGIVMGGGVGIASNCSHRCFSEKTLLAMPETGIGLLPDVGGTFILSRSPGRSGEFLGLTGTRIGVADAIYAGFADHFVPSADHAALKAELCKTGDVLVIGRYERDPMTAEAPEVAPMLADLQGEIDEIFDNSTPMAIVEDLQASKAEWAQAAAKAILRACPLSVGSTLIAIRNAREMSTIEEALAEEYRFTYRSQEFGELNEGVRAQIVDKDRNPQWASPRLEDIWPDRAMFMLSDLGENEWKHGKRA